MLGSKKPRADVSVTETDVVLRNSNDDGHSTPLGTRGRLGDMDGDGRDDWLLWDSTYFNGEVHVVTADGLASTVAVPEQSSLWAKGGGDMGISLVDGMDANSDGLADVLVRSTEWTHLGLVFGGTTISNEGTVIWDVVTTILEVPEGLNQTGVLQDIDGDGGGEFWIVQQSIGDPALDGISVFLSRATWPATLTAADADLVIAPGKTVNDAQVVGDINGDGWMDLGVAFTAAGSDWDSDVYIYFGRASWPASLDLTDADLHITRPKDSVEKVWLPEPHMVGDINGDGISDLLLRQPYETVDRVYQAGQVLVYLGRPKWPADLSFEDADATFVGTSQYQSMGDATWLLVSDLDADGCDDIVTSNYYAPDEVWSGETFILFGQDGEPAGK